MKNVLRSPREATVIYQPRDEVQVTLAWVRTHVHTHINGRHMHTPQRRRGGGLTNGSSAAQLDGKCVLKQCRVTLTHATLSGQLVL